MGNREVAAALDANCITYLIDGLNSYGGRPTGTNADEEVALTRCFFYSKPFYASPTARSECLQIKDQKRRENHESWLSVHFLPFGYDLDMSGSKMRVEQLARAHSDRGDCTILVECERYHTDYLVTRDAQFLTRLRPLANGVRVCSPIEYWALLDIPLGAPPRVVPDWSNPMGGTDWWRWQ